MKLVRYGAQGTEKVGVIDNAGALRDLSTVVHDLDASTVTLDALERLRSVDLESLPRVEGTPRLGAVLSRVETFYAIGLNYAKHADEAGMAHPEEPIVFNKSASCIAGPNDPLTLPRGAQKADWEVELGVIIGKPAQYVSAANALEHVAGYCVVNDLSERSFQIERGGQWTKGKSAPGFGPIGPYLVTADAVPDPQALSMRLALNGKTVQSSTTGDMIFSVAEIISHLSQFVELVPGDIIATGTPEGVGMGMTPPRFLSSGDMMELEIEGLGIQRTEVL